MGSVLVVTGMGRSGTSLAARIIHAAGIYMGSRLIPAGRGNILGHYEDADFVEFQDRMLLERGASILTIDSTPSPTDAERNQAAALVTGRASDGLWGWKDPRTSLFLEMWDDLLDDARYLFVFRHPLDVLLSILRKGSDIEAATISEPVQAWRVYNEAIKTFYRQSPERCALVSADLLRRPDDLLRLVREKLALPVPRSAAPGLYEAGQFHSATAQARETFALLEPEAVALFDELSLMADAGPDPSPSGQDAPGLSSLRRHLPDFAPYTSPSHRGLTLVLLELVAPDVIESWVSCHAAEVLGLRVAQRWCEEQRLSWKAFAESLEHRQFRNRVRRTLDRRLARRH